MKITVRDFGNGHISFNGKVDAVPATSTTEGNVTINNSGSPETPAHFATSFMISFDVETDGLSAYSSLVLHDSVLSPRSEVSYRDIEDKAARRIAPILRALADEIDQKMAEFDEREAARKAAL